MSRHEQTEDPRALIDPIIQNLIDSGDPEAVSLTKLTVDRIESEGVQIKTGEGLPVASLFELVPTITSSGLLIYKPTIYIKNPFDSTPFQRGFGTMEADLLRTFSLFDQFPFKGYQDRMQNVYRKAQTTEVGFLDRIGMLAIYDDNLSRILPQTRVLMDFGHADFKKVIVDYSELVSDKTTKEHVKVMGEIGTDTFVNTREYFWNCYEKGYKPESIAKFLEGKTEEDRAVFVAAAFLGMGLPNNQN